MTCRPAGVQNGGICDQRARERPRQCRRRFWSIDERNQRRASAVGKICGGVKPVNKTIASRSRGIDYSLPAQGRFASDITDKARTGKKINISAARHRKILRHIQDCVAGNGDVLVAVQVQRGELVISVSEHISVVRAAISACYWSQPRTWRQLRIRYGDIQVTSEAA